MPFPSFIQLFSIPQSGLLIAILVLGFDLDFVLAIRGLFEVADAFTQSAAYFGQSAGAKHDQNDNQYDDQFGHTESKHMYPPVKRSDFSLFIRDRTIALKGKKIKCCLMNSAGWSEL
jgi:hypothetical protein